MRVAQKAVNWPKCVRVIRSIYPPINLFEDIADPADWDALASAEEKLNPRVRQSIGDLSRVPPERRVSGAGASYVMAPFVHCSRHRPSRFSDGRFGLYYAGDRTEVAIAETAFHHGKAMAATNEAPGWLSQFRELVGHIDHRFDDVGGQADLLDPDDYRAAQQFGAARRAAGSDGMTWPSVRYPDGQCIAAFWPDVVPIPVQGDHFAYHWNGTAVDYIRNLTRRVTWRVV